MLMSCLSVRTAGAIELKQTMLVSIGLFDACEGSLSYAFNENNYDIKTTLQTVGTFGALYPFKATYHTVGVFKNFDFKPQDYFYETNSRFRHRTKEIVYENGVPQYRISVKNTKTRKDKITADPNYKSATDLLSVFGVLMQRLIYKGDCNLDMYSFNGKKYARSVIKLQKKEKVKTDYFGGEALKCRYEMEILDDADAGFLLNKDEPIYFWVMQDETTKAYFVAKILVEDTPFGKLEAITTKVEGIR